MTNKEEGMTNKEEGMTNKEEGMTNNEEGMANKEGVYFSFGGVLVEQGARPGEQYRQVHERRGDAYAVLALEQAR